MKTHTQIQKATIPAQSLSFPRKREPRFPIPPESGEVWVPAFACAMAGCAGMTRVGCEVRFDPQFAKIPNPVNVGAKVRHLSGQKCSAWVVNISRIVRDVNIL